MLTEADACRSALLDEFGLDVDAAKKEWADRAGRKGAHEVDYEARQKNIVSPSEMGY